MIVHLDLTVGFEVVGHQHDRDGNVAEFIDLKEKGKADSKPKFHHPAATIHGFEGRQLPQELVLQGYNPSGCSDTSH